MPVARIKDSSFLHVIQTEADRPIDHAVFLTYSMDLDFFQEAVIRTLRRRGCRNIAVFCDGTQIGREVDRLASAGGLGAAWMCGRYYSVTPVFHASAFHPKLALLIGERTELWIGSGNLDAPGLANNYEIQWRVVAEGEDPDAAEALGLVGQAWEYVSLIARGAGAAIPREQLALAEESAEGLHHARPPGQDMKLIMGPQANVCRELRDAQGGTRPTVVSIVSPFFDHDLRTLHELKRQLRPREIHLYVQPDTVSLPGNLLSKMGDVRLFRLRVSPSGRYAHAKVVVVESPQRSILLAGSHNLSERAFEGANYELSIMAVRDGRDGFGEELGLVPSKHGEIKLQANGLRIRGTRETAGNRSSPVLIEARLIGDTVECSIRKPINGPVRLVPYSEAGRLEALRAKPIAEKSGLIFTGIQMADSDRWRVVSLKSPEGETNAVPLHRHQDLMGRRAMGISRAIIDRSKRFTGSLDDVDELLINICSSLIQHVALRPGRAGIRGSRHQDPPRPDASAAANLRYEDFVVPWNAEGFRRGGGGSAISHLEEVLGYLGRAVDGRADPREFQAAVVKVFGDDEDRSDVHVDEEGQMGDDEGLEESTGDAGASSVATTEAPSSEQSSVLESTAPRSRIEAAKSIHRRLGKFVDHFASEIEAECQWQTPRFSILESIVDAGSLLNQFVGRRESQGLEEVCLEEWQTWVDFQQRILDSIVAERNSVLRKMPWHYRRYASYESKLESFLGYLLFVLGISERVEADESEQAKLELGVLRAGLLLGVDQGHWREEVINAKAGWLCDQLKGRLKVRRLRIQEWRGLVQDLRRIDKQLRRRYTSGSQIAKDTGKSQNQLSVGDWIWWPSLEGHLGVVVRVANETISVIVDPRGGERHVMASYVVPLRRRTDGPGFSVRAGLVS